MQAARGTSLSDATGRPQDASRHRPAHLRVLAAAIFAVLYAADVVSKVLAVERLDGQPDVEVVGDLLVLNLVRNPGAAFSTGTEYTVVLSGIAIAAVGTIVWFLRKVGSRLWAVALGTLLAGVAGNLTDRLLREPGPLRGHVVDFLMLPNWPVFNLADIFINVAAGLILVQAFRGVRIDGGREPTSRGDDTAEDAA